MTGISFSHYRASFGEYRDQPPQPVEGSTLPNGRDSAWMPFSESTAAAFGSRGRLIQIPKSGVRVEPDREGEKERADADVQSPHHGYRF